MRLFESVAKLDLNSRSSIRCTGPALGVGVAMAGSRKIFRILRSGAASGQLPQKGCRVGYQSQRPVQGFGVMEERFVVWNSGLGALGDSSLSVRMNSVIGRKDHWI